MTPTELVAAFAAGLTNQEIGGIYHLVPETVKDRARRLYADLGAHNRAHAVALVLRARAQAEQHARRCAHTTPSRRRVANTPAAVSHP